MKRVLTSFTATCFFFFTLYCQYDNSQVTGFWELQSVKFKHPVDLNKDGYKSTDAFWEFDDCRKDQQIELLADNTAKTYLGTSRNGCINKIKQYKWNLKEESVKEVKYELGKRVVDERHPTVLKLNDPSGCDSKAFVVIGVDENILTLKGLVRNDANNIEEAILIYKKRKK